MLAREQGVQPVLGLGEAARDGIAQAPQPRRPDRDQKRGDGLEPLSQVLEAGGDQVIAWKASRFHGRMVSVMRDGGQYGG